MERTDLVGICLKAGPHTEDLTQYIFNHLDDDLVDEVELDKVIEGTQELAFEPVTTAAVLAATTTTMILVCRLIEKWMEQKKQEAHLNIVYNAGRTGVPEAVVRALQDMSVKYADVSISAGPLALPQVGSGPGSGVS